MAANNETRFLTCLLVCGPIPVLFPRNLSNGYWNNVYSWYKRAHPESSWMDAHGFYTDYVNWWKEQDHGQ